MCESGGFDGGDDGGFCHQTQQMATNSRQPAGGKVMLPPDPALLFSWKQQSSLHTYLKCLVFVKGLFHLSS